MTSQCYIDVVKHIHMQFWLDIPFRFLILVFHFQNGLGRLPAKPLSMQQSVSEITILIFGNPPGVSEPWWRQSFQRDFFWKLRCRVCSRLWMMWTFQCNTHFHSFSQLSQWRFTVEALRSHFPVAGDGAIGTTGLPMFRGIFSAVFLFGTHFRFFWRQARSIGPAICGNA